MNEPPLPDRLAVTPLEPAAYSPYGDLRQSAADWAQRDVEGAAFAEEVLGLDDLLSRSYLLGQPSVAGMGLAAWDLAVPDPEALIDPERGVRRMLNEPAPPTAEAPPVDARALQRGADLLMALSRIEAARAALPESSPEEVHARLTTLHRDVQRRLNKEREHAPDLDRLIREGQALTPPEAPEDLTLARPEPTSGPLESQSPSRVFAAEAQAQGELPPALYRLALEISKLTGRPLSAILADAKGGPRRKDRGAAMAQRRKGIQISQISVDGLKDPQTAAMIDRALERLPGLLERRGAEIAGLDGVGDVRLDVDGQLIRDPDVLSGKIADALIAGGYSEPHLHLGVSAISVGGPRDLLSMLASDDVATLSAALRGERQELDGALMSRLTEFFGRDLRDVTVFSGPMAGALARSLNAEAITHGKMVFFDPGHFQPSTPQGEALLAHELTHTVQEGEDWDPRLKEAQALAVEASYLDWIRPGGAPFAAELEGLDVTAPSAAAALDVSGGVMRAEKGRGGDSAGAERAEQGPRTDTARFEERVAQVLAHVEEAIEEEQRWEQSRLGKLDGFDMR